MHFSGIFLYTIFCVLIESIFLVLVNLGEPYCPHAKFGIYIEMYIEICMKFDMKMKYKRT